VSALAAPKTEPPQAANTEQNEPQIEPKADAQLKKMSEFLAGLKSFKVTAVTADEKVTTDGQKIQDLKESKVTVVRPGRMRIDRLSVNGRASLRSDGHEFMFLNSDRKVFGTAPAPATIDEQLDFLHDKLRLDAPGEQLMVKDPYAALTDGVKEGRYLGLVPIGDQMAHHLAMTEEGTNWQIWIADGPHPVPLRFVVTSVDMKTQPQYVLELRDWQLDPSVSADAFALTPPADARRIDLMSPPTEKPAGERSAP
jgi:hypothetical protein